MNKLAIFMGVSLVFAACGGGDGNANDNGNANGNSNDNGNGNNTVTGICSEGGRASSDNYLPYTVGNSWRYRVQDLNTAAFTTKIQVLSEEMVPQGETDPVVVQLTDKDNGSTENWTRVIGDQILRFRQFDYDVNDVLEATTTYVPSHLRFDESVEHTTLGAVWNESYQKVVVDALAVETTIDVTDQWEVIGVDEECSSPLGTFSCLHIRGTRTQGGVAVKDYYYARGLGKVKEVGGQIEELEDCDLN